MCSRRGRGEEGRRGIGERDENGSLFGGGRGGGGWKAAGGLRGRGTKRREGVVPGSTNQRQDAIDRHVARGLVQFGDDSDREGGGWRPGERELLLLARGGGNGAFFPKKVGEEEVVEEGVAARGTDVFCTLRYTYW